jgi:hypothetical protein
VVLNLLAIWHLLQTASEGGLGDNALVICAAEHAAFYSHAGVVFRQLVSKIVSNTQRTPLDLAGDLALWYVCIAASLSCALTPSVLLVVNHCSPKVDRAIWLKWLEITYVIGLVLCSQQSSWLVDLRLVCGF